MPRAVRIQMLICLVLASMTFKACHREPTPAADAPEAAQSATNVDRAVPAAGESTFAEQAFSVRSDRSDTIRLDGTLVTDQDLQHLAGLEEKLHRINLSHTELTDAALTHLAKCQQLEQLRIASSRFSDDGLAPLADLPRLKHLHLIGVPLTSKALPHLKQLASLSSLYLDGTALTPSDMRSLVEALPMTHIHFDGGHHRDDAGADLHPQ